MAWLVVIVLGVVLGAVAGAAVTIVFVYRSLMRDARDSGDPNVDPKALALSLFIFTVGPAALLGGALGALFGGLLGWAVLALLVR